jgi:molecular chaperone HscC
MKHVIGIDLGTTNSLCACFVEGVPKLIANPHGSYLTPSVVGLLDDERILVGQAAKELRVTRPERCVSRFKRWMGTSEKTSIGKRTFTAPELSSFVLRSLKDDAETFFQSTVHQAVITVPAYFNENQRRATRAAGELAGLDVLRIINEPTAAALTYGFHDQELQKKLLVIDLGGGTFDVTLMEVFEGALEIISTAGESMLGGEDFTDRLVASILQTRGMRLEMVELKQPLLAARLRQSCEVAKLALLNQASVTVTFPNDRGMIDDTNDTIQLHREDFAERMKPLLERLLGPINRALRDARTEPQQIDDVILVGGATRMHCLQSFVADYLKTTPKSTFNPDEVVALGAAVQAALLAEDRAVDDLVMTDVCPHTLGIEITKRFGEQLVHGFYEPIIHRNTTIPVSKESVFSTLEPNQYSVSIRVFQGESRKVKENTLLGELTVDGLPPAPAGTEFAVRFTYDSNGILEVEAYVPTTGKKYHTILTNHAVVMSKEELKAAVAKMQLLKFYPRDDIENQRLLRFCERVIGEIEPRSRPDLEAAVDAWERSMNSGDQEFFQNIRAGLLLLLQELGFKYDAHGRDEFHE